MKPILSESKWDVNLTTGEYVLRSCPPGTMLINQTANKRFNSEVQECRPCALDECASPLLPLHMVLSCHKLLPLSLVCAAAEISAGWGWGGRYIVDPNLGYTVNKQCNRCPQVGVN
jgi:hypothetical protein